MKGTQKQGLSSNVKPMAGGVAIAQLKSGDYVYGDVSSTGSDLINFTHFYRADGTLFELGTPCKVTVTNLVMVNEAEPGTPPVPDPTPTPTPAAAIDHIVVYFQDGTTQTFVPQP